MSSWVNNEWVSAIETSPILTDLGRLIGTEMIETFSQFFSTKVLSNLNHPLWNISVGGLNPYNQAPQVFYKLLNLYCHIKLMRFNPNVRGLHKWRLKIGHNPEPSSWRHLSMQMELAGFALRDNYCCELESRYGDGKTSDVTIFLSDSGEQMEFEVTSLGETQENSMIESIHRELEAVCCRLQGDFGISIHGVVFGVPSNTAEREELYRRLKSASKRASLYRVRKTVKSSWCRLVVTICDDNQVFPNVVCKHRPVDTWGRIERKLDVLSSKAGSDGLWIRIDEVSGLFAFTPWSRLSFARRLKDLVILSEKVFEKSPNLDGIVLTDHGMISLQQNIDYRMNNGIGLRRQLGFNWAKETFIIYRDERVHGKAQKIEQWFDMEPSWLDWACEEIGVSKFRELVIGEDGSKRF